MTVTVADVVVLVMLVVVDDEWVEDDCEMFVGGPLSFRSNEPMRLRRVPTHECVGDTETEAELSELDDDVELRVVVGGGGGGGGGGGVLPCC